MTKEEYRKHKKEYYKINKIKKLEYQKRYYIENKTKVDQYHKDWLYKKLKEDDFYKISTILRASTRNFLINQPKKSKYTDIIGCSSEQFRKYIKSLFKEGMSFENYGNIWEIDHIIPLRSFDLTDNEQYLRAAHYSNIQPLFKCKNRTKGDKINGISVRESNIARLK